MSERSSRVEPNWSAWSVIDVTIEKRDGGRLDATLLRDPQWMEANRPRVGSTIPMDTPELNAIGKASVLAVRDAAKVDRGPGEVVIATFRHTSSETIDLAVEGMEKPIGTTVNHPIWSVDRAQFIPANELRVGEELQLFDESTVRLTSITPRGPPEPVYNFTVHGEHTYFVGREGLLVHNEQAYGRSFAGSTRSYSENFDTALGRRLTRTDNPYATRFDPAFPNRPDPKYSIDTLTFSSGTQTSKGGIRNAKEFWHQWLELRPESISKSNRYLIENFDKLKVSPRIDETWISVFPEHVNFKRDVLIHHHVDFGRYAIPVPGKTHVGSGGIWHTK